MKRNLNVYETPQTEVVLFTPSRIIAQSPDPLSLPGTVVDPFVIP